LAKRKKQKPKNLARGLGFYDCTGLPEWDQRS